MLGFLPLKRHENMELLTVKEVSEMLKTKPSTIYSWAAQRLIPSLKINGLLRFSEKDISDWMETCQNTPVQGYNIPTGRRPEKGEK